MESESSYFRGKRAEAKSCKEKKELGQIASFFTSHVHPEPLKKGCLVSPGGRTYARESAVRFLQSSSAENTLKWEGEITPQAI